MTYAHAIHSDPLDRVATKTRPGLLNRIGHALEQRRARRELAELPAHLLRDIGLVDQAQHDTNARSMVAEVNRTLQSTGASW